MSRVGGTAFEGRLEVVVAHDALEDAVAVRQVSLLGADIRSAQASAQGCRIVPLLVAVRSSQKQSTEVHMQRHLSDGSQGVLSTLRLCDA